MQFILIVLCAIFVGAFLYIETRKKYVSALIFKGLASVCFVLLGLLCSGGGEVARILVYGLILGCVADVLLNIRFVLKKKELLIYLLGIAVFLAGHIVYLIAILTISSNWPVCFVIGMILTVFLIIWMYKRITTSRKIKIAGAIYLEAIMLLNAVAIGNVIASPGSFTFVFALGTFLFLVSDVLLILNTFGSDPKRSIRIIHILLYYAGQVLIALSLKYV